MTRKWFLPAMLGAAVLGTFGCAPKQDVRPDKASADEADKGPASVHVEKRGDEKVTAYDLNRDGKPDVWTYTVTTKGADGKEVERTVRKELDLNFDGKVDVTRYYDEKEQIEREMSDMDYDGKVDVVDYYEKGIIVRKERFTNTTSSKPRVIVYYEKGKIARKEEDLNGDGKIDYWEYWEGDQVDRIGEDLDGDGNVDRWTKNPETAANGG